MRGRKRQRKKNSRRLLNRIFEAIKPSLRSDLLREAGRPSLLGSMVGPDESFPFVLGFVAGLDEALADWPPLDADS